MQADVVVVGAGVVGCGIAYQCMLKGLRVVLLEAGTPSEGTSANSFSWINGTSKTADEDYHRLNARGCEHYRALAVTFGERSLGMYPTGMLEWADPGSPIELATLEDRSERLRRFGYPTLSLDAVGLRALEPHVSFADDAVGLYAYADAWLDVPVFVKFLIGQLSDGGASVFTDCVAQTLLVGGAGEVTGVRSANVTVHAPRVVVATGVDTPQVLAQMTDFPAFASRFPISVGPGLLVSTPTIDAPWLLARHVLYSPLDGHLHVRPTPNGGLLLGADDTDGLMGQEPDAECMALGAARLLERTQQLIPRFAGASLLDACRMRLGLRPMPADGQSIIGALPGAEGLYVAVTHSGVTLSQALGEVMATHFCDDTPMAALERFSPARFQTLRV